MLRKTKGNLKRAQQYELMLFKEAVSDRLSWQNYVHQFTGVENDKMTENGLHWFVQSGSPSLLQLILTSTPNVVWSISQHSRQIFENIQKARDRRKEKSIILVNIILSMDCCHWVQSFMIYTEVSLYLSLYKRCSLSLWILSVKSKLTSGI